MVNQVTRHLRYVGLTCAQELRTTSHFQHVFLQAKTEFRIILYFELSAVNLKKCRFKININGISQTWNEDKILSFELKIIEATVPGPYFLFTRYRMHVYKQAY